LTLLTLLTATALAPFARASSFPLMQSAFTGGELSPLAAARLDAERYYRSATTLENLLPVPQGPLLRRPGTYYVAATDSNNLARLIPFRYSTDDSYVLEFTANLMRVFRDHGLVETDAGAIYELATPFEEGDLANLQVLQNADVCYLVDGNDWPQELTRSGHNSWTIADAGIDDGPFLDENLTAATIAADGTTGTVTLTASADTFVAGHVGSLWRLRDLVEISSVAGTLSAAATGSATVSVQAENKFQWSVGGTWTGTLELQMSYDAGSTWSAYTIVTATGAVSSPTEVYTNDTGQDVLIRAYCTAYTSGTIGYTVWAHAYMHVGVVQITKVSGARTAAATVLRTLANTDATVRWSEGAWSEYRGHPAAVGSYNDRIVYAATTYQPLTLWFSKTGEYEDFTAGTDDDDSFGYEMGRSEQDPILWLQSQRKRGLVVGTTGSLFELEPLDTTQAIKPNNPPSISNTLALPCAAVPPVMADNILLVLQRGGRKLREVLYSYDADALVAPDLTLFAEHVTEGGLTGLAWCQQPHTILWSCRADGQLVALTYDRNFQVVAWSRHPLGGAGVVESLCAIPGATEDELWLTVRRSVDGATVRYVEYLKPWDWGDDQEDAYFVDGGLSYDSTAATTISGLDHLEGEDVAICADGAPVAGKTVASGAVTLDVAASVVHVGWSYTSTLTTVRYDLAGEQGTTWQRRKAVSRLTASVAETLGAAFGPDAASLYEPPYTTGGAPLLAGVPDLFTGDLEEMTLPTSYATDGARVTVVQSYPLPLTLRALVATVEVR
jgi:hypothetical protein